MKPLLLVPALLFALTMPAAACSTDASPVEPLLEQAVSRFAFDLYQKVSTEAGNVVSSPLSLHIALLMALEGAEGETAAEMSEVLGIAPGTDGIGRAARTLLKRLTRARKGSELQITNMLWGQSGYGFRPEYLKTASADYGARIEEANFRQDAEAALRAINAAVAGSTNGRIRKLLGPGDVNALTRLVLTNAIWFKAAWSTPFHAHLTADKTFNLTADSAVKVPMMHGTSMRRYHEDDRDQVLELTYQGGLMSMIVVLPREGQDLRALERDLSLGLWKKWMNGLTARSVAAALPKFKVEQRAELQKHLEAMGMVQAFSNQADFSGIVEQPEDNLAISKVVQKAWVRVDEDGTEAAAATAVIMKRSAGIRPAVDFVVDRPFLFALQEKASSVPSIMGRVVDPR